MKNYTLLITGTIVYSLSIISPLFAQDPQFTQFYANPLYLNPAFAGVETCPRLIFNYRNQWPAIPNAFVTYSASYDQHVNPLFGGVGLQVINDRAGDGILSTTTVSGMYSYLLRVTREISIKAGAQATYFQKKVDWNRLVFGDMIDPRAGIIYETQEQRGQARSGVDFSAGVLAYSKYYYGGVAVHHLTEPDESFISPPSPLPMKITAHAGATIPVEGAEDLSISPNILYQRQRVFQQLNLGVYVNKGPLVGGVWYRHQDAVILLLGLHQPRFKVAYSYDITVSKLTYRSAGSHELSFAWRFDCKIQNKRKGNYGAINCPHF